MAQYQSSLTGPEIDAALTDMARHDSEAWAVGTRDGAAVSSLDITYHNNAEYYATNAQAAAARAEAAVPPSTAGAVFFDRVQSLTDAQKNQARTNISAQSNDGGVLKIGTYVSVGQATIPNHTSVSGWYRIADVDNTGLASIQYPQIFVISTGSYTNYRPTEFSIVGAFPTYGSNAYARLTQLSGSVGLTYTKFRVSNDNRVYHLEVYFSSNSSSGSGVQEFFIAAVGGTLVTYSPTAPIDTAPANVVIEHELRTTPTEAVNFILKARNHVTGISSLAAMKTQLSTWYAAQGAGSLGYYTMALSGTISPITPSSASLGVEIRAGATANYGTALLTAHSTNGGTLYIMALNNGTWTDPVRIS